jgi:hypothetical protein
MAASIPWEILKSSKRPLRVLDPMAGSGTSLIVARGSGHAAWRFDSDPLAVLVSQVGTVDLSASRLKACAHSVLQTAKQAKISGSDAYPQRADEETCRFVRYWFDVRARKQLAALAKAIREVRDVGTLYIRGTGTLLEIEAGRGVTNNQFLKDFFQACVMYNVNYFAVAVRKLYRRNKDFEALNTFFDVLYASGRLTLPLKGILIIGY